MKRLRVNDLFTFKCISELAYSMPFAAFCKKCKIEKNWAEHDNSHAYMIGLKLSDIQVEISKHFRNVHNLIPEPTPDTLSWNKDFTKADVELSQYGGIERDLSHLTFTFPTRQFNSDDYKISVITHHHYDECIRKIEHKGRIDLELYEYF